MTKATTLAELEAELEQFYSTIDDEKVVHILELQAEQERLQTAIEVAKAKTAKAKPAEGKAKPAPTPEPTPTPAAEPTPLNVASYAKQHGLDGRELRSSFEPKDSGHPMKLSDVEKIAKAVKS